MFDADVSAAVSAINAAICEFDDATLAQLQEHRGTPKRDRPAPMYLVPDDV